MKIGRLRIGKQLCSDHRSYSIASWQYVTGYWRWCLYWWPADKSDLVLKFGPSFASGTRYHGGIGHFGCWLRLPRGMLSFSTQPPFPEMKRWTKQDGT